MEELFDICTPEGVPTGERIARSEAHMLGSCHRTAHVWVVRSLAGKIQILMQKRSEDKDSFPGCFDTSSAGHIKAGDEPLPSALRELEEELGIEASSGELTFAGTFRNRYEREFHGKPFRDNEVAFVYVYDRPVEAEELKLQEEEVSAVQWFDLEYVYREKLAGNETFCVPVEGLRTLMRFLTENETRAE